MLYTTTPTNTRKALWLCQFLQLLRSPNRDTVMTQRLAEELGTVHRHASAAATTSLPAWYYGENSQLSVMAIDGAVNSSLVGQTWDGYQGGLLTSQQDVRNGFIDQCATTMEARRQATAVGARDLDIVCGWSLGGAIAQVLTTMPSPKFQTANTQVISFGAPRPGGEGIAGRLSAAGKARYFNDDDWIPLLPPRVPNWYGWALSGGTGLARRFARFVHPAGGLMLGNTGGITHNELPNITQVPGVVNLATQYLVEMGPGSGSHTLPEMQRRLIAAINRESVQQEVVHDVAPREHIEHNVAREIRRGEVVMQAGLFNLGQVQNERPVIIPRTRLFQARRVRRVWYVYFGDMQVCIAPIRRRAQGIAAAGNDFVRRLQRQAVVDPAALSQQFVTYLQLASDPGSGFTPTLNTHLPPLPA